jgi:type VI secretion system protein ImpB
MSRASPQQILEKMRSRPRVHIKYEVEKGDAFEVKELPFVVAVMADLSAQRKEPLPSLDKRNLDEIDRDNINQILKKAAPRLVLKVQDRLSGKDQKLGLELNFNHLDDFEPAQVAEQIEPLRELLRMRERLKEASGKVGANRELKQLMEDVMSNTARALALAKQMGVEPGSAPATADTKPTEEPTS